jgi:hypothetical protein
MIKSLTEGMPKVKIPALTLDYKTLFADFAPLQRRMFDQLRPALEAIQIAQREQFAEVISRIRAAVRAALPPNWRGEDVVLPKNLEVLLLDEGLPLAWLPQRRFSFRIFAAQTACGGTS